LWLFLINGKQNRTFYTKKRNNIKRKSTQMPVREFQVIGREVPTEQFPQPKIYRMKLFATDEVCAKSKFFYFMNKLQKVKRSRSQVLAVNEIFEKRPDTIKNFGIWLRYNSRSGTHNMYKEYRDTTLVGAITQMYMDMSGRHRARKPTIQIIKTKEVAAADTRRANIKQFHDSKIKFPLTRRIPRPPLKKFQTTFKAKRPNMSH
jgi:large subunit ribosomal protein L18Ae